MPHSLMIGNKSVLSSDLRIWVLGVFQEGPNSRSAPPFTSNLSVDIVSANKEYGF